MKSYRGPLSYRALWSVRWLSGTLFTAQLLFSIVGLWLFTHPREVANLWMGGALATLPGYLVGLVIQFNADLTQLKQNKWTVVLLGVISIAVFGFGLRALLRGTHAG